MKVLQKVSGRMELECKFILTEEVIDIHAYERSSESLWEMHIMIKTIHGFQKFFAAE